MKQHSLDMILYRTMTMTNCPNITTGLQSSNYSCVYTYHTYPYTAVWLKWSTNMHMLIEALCCSQTRFSHPFLPVRRYARPGTSYRPVYVCHKDFYRNGWQNRAGFWHRSFLRPILHCFKKTRVSPKIRLLPSGTLVPNSTLRKFHHGITGPILRNFSGCTISKVHVWCNALTLSKVSTS